MSDETLYTLADAAGLLVDWKDAGGTARRVEPPTLRAVLGAMGLPAQDDAACRDSLRRVQSEPAAAAALHTFDVGDALAVDGTPGARYQLRDEHGTVAEGRFDAQGRGQAVHTPGYWTLDDGRTHRTLAIAPRACFGVADAAGEPGARRWGLALQAYSARSPLDAGIGDAAGAADWVRRVADAGGDALALSPLHAARPVGSHYSPYSPSDRRFLDPLYAAPDQVLGQEAARQALQAAGLEASFEHLHASALLDWPAAARAKWAWIRQLYAGLPQAAPELQQDLERFVHAGGEALAGYTTFAAHDFGDEDPQLHAFAQWLVARSWADVQRQAREGGMALGLIADLAVGFDPAGAEAAAWPQAVLPGLVLGAPPDAFNAAGQVWGIGSYSPAGLRSTGFAPFLSLLRAVMRDRGGVRIDHILGLLRLWVVPQGAGAADGAYLRYPLHDLLRLLALESWRHRAVVIGEDLGVVPDGLRDELSRRGVMGIDVLLFTRDEDGNFLPPAQWRGDAVATTSTHDLPPLAGWRQGKDIQWRRRLQLSSQEDTQAEQATRQQDVQRLDQALEQASGRDDHAAALAFVSSTPAPLALLPVEDALALDEQPNLPGTVEGHPNWSRRLPPELPEAALRQALDAFDRPRHATHDKAGPA